MIQVLVKSVFYDKYDHSRVFVPGQAVTFEEGRAADIVTLGLADYMAVEPKENKAETPAPQPAQAEPEPVLFAHDEQPEETPADEEAPAPMPMAKTESKKKRK